MPKEDIFVKSALEFPNWKFPCPKCQGEKSISSRKDKTGAWCKKCGQNWKVVKQEIPQGWDKPSFPQQTAEISELPEEVLMLDEIINLANMLKDRYGNSQTR
jgi:hypothetical protein